MGWELGDIDRPRGFLTESDRRYLRGDRTFEDMDDPDNAERAQRFRIRERARHALLDFAVLTHALDPDDADNIVPTEDEDPEKYLVFLDAYAALTEFYQLYVARDPDEPFDQDPETLFYMFAEGVERALRDEALINDAYGVPEFKGEVSTRYAELVKFDELVDRINRGDPVTQEQIDALLWAGRITEHQAENAVTPEDVEGEA